MCKKEATNYIPHFCNPSMMGNILVGFTMKTVAQTKLGFPRQMVGILRASWLGKYFHLFEDV